MLSIIQPIATFKDKSSAIAVASTTTLRTPNEIEVGRRVIGAIRSPHLGGA